ncbi:hypothetical protein KEM55_007251 [Ascosphaera atra]|nr:hypothetical protein KEM55_007251 [Ascosphaera atra]
MPCHPFRRVIVRKDPQNVAEYIADYIISRIEAFSPSPEKPFVLGLPTGSSPEKVYRILVERHKAGVVSFKNVVTFNMVRQLFPCITRDLPVLTSVFRTNMSDSLGTIHKAITASCTRISFLTSTSRRRTSTSLTEMQRTLPKSAPTSKPRSPWLVASSSS